MLATVLVTAMGLSSRTEADDARAPGTYDVSNASLLRELPGFASNFVTVNGIRLHYVAGGNGSPVFLLPGWPQT